jgi:hypothetical protein
MKTKEQLHKLEDHELIHEILCLQKIIEDRKIEESKCSAIHNYHFASNGIIKLTKDRFLGSAIILGGIYNLRGELLVDPVSISNGLSNNTINGLLDDLEATYNRLIEFKPTTERLK